MTITTGPAPQRADARRNVEAIMLAAETCLARDPDASMGDIATAAGLGRVTLYGHFASRQALIEAVVHRILAVTDAALTAIDLSGDATGALRRLIDASWQLTMRTGSLLVAAEKALPSATVWQAHEGGLEDRVRTFIAEAQRRGEFRSDLPAEWLTATLHAVVHAAATEIDAGRLSSGEASAVIYRTMLGILQPGSGVVLEPVSAPAAERSRSSSR